MGRSLLAAIALVLAVHSSALAQSAPKRPPLLIPLYASSAVLHGLDVHSTVSSLAQGHRELNPLFRSGSVEQMIATKVAAGAAGIFLSEKLWKKRPKTAMFVMIATNATLSAVVAHNYRLANR
jgi:hypothetical protein